MYFFVFIKNKKLIKERKNKTRYAENETKTWNNKI